MHTTDIASALSRVFAELTDGPRHKLGVVLNIGDGGLLRSLDKLIAGEASEAVHGGATIAAHAQHVRYGLSLMNRWAAEGGNPFADATWEAAWTITAVDGPQWQEIRSGLRDESQRWLKTLKSPREVTEVELAGMVASISHLAYHLGAMRQIDKNLRGPKEGTYQ